jgi:3-oxoacyl-[acyl-carrier protein] reductase
VSTPKPFADMAPDELTEGLVSKYAARLFPVHAAIGHLRERPGASVVLLTTDAGRHATIGEVVVGAYAASIIQVTKSLARELSRDRIRVNAVSMTLTADTRSWDSIFAREGFQNALFSKAVARFPFGQPPAAADVAEAVVFLASTDAAQITGQTVSVNGGLSFGGW